jgi:hypothetical protein
MLLGLLLTLLAGAPSVQKDLAAVELAYEETEFEEAIAKASRLLKRNRVSKSQKKRLHELSAFSFFYLGKKGPAEAQLLELFELDEAAGIDRKKATPELAAFFDEVKLRWMEARKKPEPQPLAEIEAVPDEPPRDKPTELQQSTSGRPPFRAVSLIPFGIGQLALGDYAVGTVLLVLNAALATTMITLYYVRQGEKIDGGPFYADPQRANLMQIFQNVAAFGLIGVAVLGFIDALVWAPLRVQTKEQQVTLVPSLAPVLGGATVGIGGQF